MIRLGNELLTDRHRAAAQWLPTTDIHHCHFSSKAVFLSTLASSHFQEKISESHVVLRRNFFGPVSATDLVKGSKGAASLLVRTRKNFLLGGADFLSVTS